MKLLTIIRHAQAENGGLGTRDIDRALSEQGQADARNLAHLIAKLSPPIDHIICSSAKRTHQTYSALRGQLGMLPEAVLSDAAYLAPPEMLQILLQNAPTESAHAAIIAHNPGVEKLVALLCNPIGSHLNLGMATGTVAHVLLQIDSWTQLDWGRGHLLAFVPPDFM